jgi:spermidine/putrescine-binding protein
MSTPTALECLVAELHRGRISRRAFVNRATALGLSLTSIGMLLTACGGGDRGEDSDEASGAAGDLGPMGKELRVYNWSDYIAPDTVPNFEKEFGVEVVYDTYESNEEMVAKLQAGATGYDIIVPSGYTIPVLVALDLIAPLTKTYLTNWGNVSPLFQNLPSDPDSEHSVPWQWGTSGIAYRTDRVDSPPESWAVFHDPGYRDKMTMMDDGREVIGAFLRYRGHSLNSTDPEQLATAKADAIQAKKYLKAYLSAPVKAQLITGDVWISQLWNGDTTQAKSEQPNLEYLVPKEGCTIFADSMCMPRSAPNKRAAHEWMNYILRPEVGAAISNATGYGTPNAVALGMLDVRVPYPTEEELERLEFQVDLGRATEVWDRLWTEIKSA